MKRVSDDRDVCENTAAHTEVTPHTSAPGETQPPDLLDRQTEATSEILALLDEAAKLSRRYARELGMPGLATLGAVLKGVADGVVAAPLTPEEITEADWPGRADA